MWTTGFDVPSCSTIYLDKADEETHAHADHRACQPGIPEKANGLIVDYVGVFRDLEKALAIYASPVTGDGGLPVKDKSELVELLRQQIASTTRFCAQHGVDIDALLPLSGFRND